MAQQRTALLLVMQSAELRGNAGSNTNAEDINKALLLVAIVLPVILIIIIILLVAYIRRQQRRHAEPKSHAFRPMLPPSSPSSNVTSTNSEASPKGVGNHHDQRMPTPARPDRSSALTGKHGGGNVPNGTMMALQGVLMHEWHCCSDRPVPSPPC